jgi:hypothetical protein
MCACVGSLSNRLQMPRQRKELWAIVRGASRPHHTHTHSYTRMRVSCVCVCACACRVPAEAVVGDGRSKYTTPTTPPRNARARVRGVWPCAVHLPIVCVCVLQKGGVGIAQCAVRTMPTTDANTACPTQNNPARAHTHVIHTVVATAAAAAAGWRRTAVRSVALSNVYYYYYY